MMKASKAQKCLMKSRMVMFLALAGLFVLSPKAAWADGVSYNFGGCTDSHVCSGNVGSANANYTSSGYTITATAVSLDGDTLFIKTGTGDEHGLGMTGTRDDEIQPGEFMQLNVSSLAKAGFASGSLIFGSVQPGEGYKICFSNVAGSISRNCFSGQKDGSPVSVNFKGYKYIDIGVTTGDVLLARAFIATPEPSSLVLLGSGLLALVGFRMKKAIA